MLELILLAIIGTTIQADELYWMVYGIAVIVWIIKFVLSIIKIVAEKFID